MYLLFYQTVQTFFCFFYLVDFKLKMINVIESVCVSVFFHGFDKDIPLIMKNLG